ncbi:MAG: hypothetical protein Q9160_007221 [Pyrenula sp. 1 TL-2023]
MHWLHSPRSSIFYRFVTDRICSTSACRLHPTATVASSSLLHSWTNNFRAYAKDLSSTVFDQLATLSKALSSPPPAPTRQPLLDRFVSIFDSYSALSYTTVAATLLALLFIGFSMSSFGRSGFDSWSGRRSPYTAHAGHGTVTNDDFEYVDADAFEAPGRSNAATYTQDDPNSPDIIRLQHKNHLFEVRFDPFAISDGNVTVGHLRERAADKLIGRGGDPRRIKLIYKAKQLKDDSKPAKLEGLKQLSQVMCVVSNAIPHGSSSESSASEKESTISSTTNGSLTSQKKQRRKSKKKTSKDSLDHTIPDRVSPSNETPRSSSPQKPSAAGSPQGKVDQLASTFHTSWVPKCVQYLNNRPANAKSIEQEHKRLTVSIEEQIMLKADEIELQGDPNARQERKKLLNEVQLMLKSLDEAYARYTK